MVVDDLDLATVAVAEKRRNVSRYEARTTRLRFERLLAGSRTLYDSGRICPGCGPGTIPARSGSTSLRSAAPLFARSAARLARRCSFSACFCRRNCSLRRFSKLVSLRFGRYLQTFSYTLAMFGTGGRGAFAVGRTLVRKVLRSLRARSERAATCRGSIKLRNCSRCRAHH